MEKGMILFANWHCFVKGEPRLRLWGHSGVDYLTCAVVSAATILQYFFSNCGRRSVYERIYHQ
jgi:hypothetical protein